MSETARFILHTDGASRGNPGPAAIGAVIAMADPEGDPIPVAEISACIGTTTNNVAEYRAVIAALTRARELGARRIELRTDSELLVKQLHGEYRVKNAGLKPLFAEVRALLERFDAAEVRHVRREENRDADRLANQALNAARRRRRA